MPRNEALAVKPTEAMRLGYQLSFPGECHEEREGTRAGRD